MKKSNILTLIPKKMLIYHTKTLCHHVEHILFYLWSKYGVISTNIVSPIESFFIKLHSKTLNS